MKKSVTLRAVADKTRKSILQAAQTLFVEKGFSGVSISEIAKKARIHQSLIYHHFKNKEALWQQVKLQLVTEHVKLHPRKTLEELADKDLMTFLEHIVRSRFYLYWKNPDIVRIINWQRLEPHHKELHASCYASPEEWCYTIEKLQKRGEISKKLSPEWVMIFVTNAIAGLFIDYDLFFTKKKKPISEKYMTMMISTLYKALQ